MNPKTQKRLKNHIHDEEDWNLLNDNLDSLLNKKLTDYEFRDSMLMLFFENGSMVIQPIRFKTNIDIKISVLKKPKSQ